MPPALFGETSLHLDDSPSRYCRVIGYSTHTHTHTYHECVVLKLMSKIKVSKEIAAHLRRVTPWHAGTHWTHLIEWRDSSVLKVS